MMITRVRNASDFAHDVHELITKASARCDEVLVAQIDRPEEGVWWWHHGRFPGTVLLDAMLAAVSSTLVDKWQVIKRGKERVDFLQHVGNPRYDCASTEVGDGGRAIGIGLASAALSAPIGSAVLVYPSITARPDTDESLPIYALPEHAAQMPGGVRPFPFTDLGLAYDGNEVRAFANASQNEQCFGTWEHPFVSHIAAPLARASYSLRNGAPIESALTIERDVPEWYHNVDWYVAARLWIERELDERRHINELFGGNP